MDLQPREDKLPSFLKMRRQEHLPIPQKTYTDFNAGTMEPAFVPRLEAERTLKKDKVDFTLLSQGQHPFIILPEPPEFDEQTHQISGGPGEVAEELFDLFANFDDADYWYSLNATVRGRGGRLYLIAADNQRFLVEDVILDFGGESGRLKVRGLGSSSRQGTFLADIEDVARSGNFLPVITMNYSIVPKESE